MAGALSLIWGRIIHDLTLYEHEFSIEEVGHSQFRPPEEETPEEREERLHTEVAGEAGPTL